MQGEMFKVAQRGGPWDVDRTTCADATEHLFGQGFGVGRPVALLVRSDHDDVEELGGVHVERNENRGECGDHVVAGWNNARGVGDHSPADGLACAEWMTSEETHELCLDVAQDALGAWELESFA